MAIREGMRVPDGIEYVWTVRLADGSVVENFVEKDGELYEIGFWTLPPKKIRELFVISTDGTERLFRVDVSDPDVLPIWFRRNVVRLYHGGGEKERFVEGYYFGFRKISTNEKFVVKVSGNYVEILADDDRGEIDRTREKSLRYRFKRWRARGKDRRALKR